MSNYSQELSQLNAKLKHLSVNTEAQTKAITELNLQLQMKPEAAVINCTAVIAQSVVQNIPNLKSNDPAVIATGVLSVIGTISATGVFGPQAQAAGALCSVVASVIPLLGGRKQQSTKDAVREIIKQAFDEAKDEVVEEKLEYNSLKINRVLGALNTYGEMGGVMDKQQALVLQNPDYQDIGFGILSVLITQIRLHKHTTKHSKAKKIAKYIFHYCVVSIMRRSVLTLLCTLLKLNGKNFILNGTIENLNNEFNISKPLLDFIYKPNKKNRKLYRYIQTNEVLTPDQKKLIWNYRNFVGCKPMAGYYCNIFNIVQKEYLYAADYSMRFDSERRNVFTWKHGKRVNQGGWRIFPVGKNQGEYLYNIYHGEYLYAADAHIRSDRQVTDVRRVLTWMYGSPTSQSGWQLDFHQSPIKNAIIVSFKNVKRSEYLVASVITPQGKVNDGKRRYVFTPKGKKNKLSDRGYWEIRNQSLIGDMSNYQFH